MKKEPTREVLETEAAPEYLLVLHTASGKLYQMFSTEDAYLFHRVDGLPRDPRLLGRCPTPEEYQTLSGANFAVKKSSVVQAFFSPRSGASPRGTGRGTLSLWTPKKRTFLLQEDLSVRQVQLFFRDLGPRMKLDPRAAAPSAAWPRMKREDPVRYRRLHMARIAFAALGGISSALFLLVIRPYALWSGLCIFSWAASILLTLAFPDCFSPAISRYDSAQLTDTKSFGLVWPVLAAGAGPALRSLLDFNFVPFWSELLAGVLLSLLLIALYCWRYPELRRRFLAFITVWFVLFVFSLGIPAQLNALLDHREPETVTVEVLNKHVYHGRGGTAYILTVRLPDGTARELDTSRSIYDETESGDRRTMAIHPGALHMPYALFVPAE